MSRPRRWPRIPAGTGRLAELPHGVGAHAWPGHDERDRIAGMDHLGRGRGRVVAGHADDRAVVRQVFESSVEGLDHLQLFARILCVPRGVRALHVAQDERVTGLEPFARDRDPAAQVRCGVVGFAFLTCVEAHGKRQAAQECGARDEGARAARGAARTSARRAAFPTT